MQKPSRKKILIVDDEPINNLFLSELLEEHFDLTQVENGDDALATIDKDRPDLVLLDIVMPGKSGLEICKTLKNNASTASIPVIFLSALDQLADRMAGYNAGGDGYISKPFSGLEVLTKIKLALDKKESTEKLADAKQSHEEDNNVDIAMKYMSHASEIGQIHNFFKNSVGCSSIETLCQLVLDTCSSLNLKATIQINKPEKSYYSHDSNIENLDMEILSTLSNREPLIYFGQRCLINFANISLLIKNMPTEDEEEAECIKENMTLIMEVADVRLTQLINEKQFDQQKADLANILAETKQLLATINDNNVDQINENLNTLESQLNQLNNS